MYTFIIVSIFLTIFVVPLIKVKGCVYLNGTLKVNYLFEQPQRFLLIESRCVIGNFDKIEASGPECKDVETGELSPRYLFIYFLL